MANREKRNKSRGSAGNNRKVGEDFLEKNRRKEGVKETESGLQYLVLEEGDGDNPDANANIKVHQRCQLVNGTIIEDTYRENEKVLRFQCKASFRRQGGLSNQDL